MLGHARFMNVSERKKDDNRERKSQLLLFSAGARCTNNMPQNLNLEKKRTDELFEIKFEN